MTYRPLELRATAAVDGIVVRSAAPAQWIYSAMRDA